MSFAFMPIYTGDYLRDTRHLTPLKHGIYFLLLMHCWDQKGPLPLDEQECAGIANCRSADEIDALRYVLSRFFVRMEDGHYNKRMAEEVTRAAFLSQVYSKAGIKSAQIRAARTKVRKAKAEPELNQGSTAVGTPTPTPTLTPTPTPTPTENQEEANLPESPHKPRRPRAATPTRGSSPDSTATWLAYSEAYTSRYGVSPLRNARVNTAIARLIALVGLADAPHVAAHYLRSERAAYVRATHGPQLLIRDAEALHTEWRTNRHGTDTAAYQGDRASTTGQNARDLIEDMRRENKS